METNPPRNSRLELIDADEPWVESRFETREKVRARCAFSIRGDVVVPAGSEGEVFKVLRDLPDGVHYHVHFPGGRMLQVAETLLDEAPHA